MSQLTSATSVDPEQIHAFGLINANDHEATARNQLEQLFALQDQQPIVLIPSVLAMASMRKKCSLGKATEMSCSTLNSGPQHLAPSLLPVIWSQERQCQQHHRQYDRKGRHPQCSAPYVQAHLQI